MSRAENLSNDVDTMADYLSGMCDGSVFRTMGCSEVEAIADVLRTNGNTAVAEAIIEDHALTDDEGDSHWDIRVKAEAAMPTGEPT